MECRLLSTEATEGAVSDEVLKCLMDLEEASDRTDDTASSSVRFAEVNVVSAPSVDHDAAGIPWLQVALDDDGDVTAISHNSVDGENGAGAPNPESAA